MAYIGRSVDIGMFEKQVLTADSSTTTFTLTFAVGSANSLLVVYGGVIQEPAVAYSVSGGGQQIVFSEAPATGTTTYIIYLGKQLTTPRAAGQETTKQTFTGNGSTVTYTLTDPPVVPAGIMVFVDGILQREGSGNNYVSSGSTITFSTAPDTSAEIDVYTLVKEKVSIDTVADGSITFAKLVAGSPTWNGAGETVIATASTGNSLRITNTGSGNSLLVEDSASTDSTPFVITAAGDVGVGTASPASTLEVSQSANGEYGVIIRNASNGVVAGSLLKFIAGTDVGQIIRFPASHSSKANQLFITNVGATSPITFATQDTERMRIDSSGNVGIATTTIATNFRQEIVGLAGSNTSAATTGTTQAASAVMRIRPGGGFTGTLDIGQGGGTGSWIQSTDTANLATTYPLLLNPVGGNVGIGTSSPAYRLDVGTSSVTGNIHTYGSITSGTLAGYSIRGVPRLTNDTGTFENTYIGCGASVGNIIFQQGNSFTAASNTERMRIDSSGNVGIGTNAPSTEAVAARLALVGSAAQDANSLATSNTKAVFSLRGDSNSGYSTAFGTLTTTDDQYIQGVNFSGGAASCNLVLQPFSGNLGIGTGNIAPASRLDIFTSTAGGLVYPITLSANNGASAKTNYTQIGFGIAQGAAGSETGGFELKSLRNNTFVNLAQYDGAAGSAAWKFYTEGSERMRIDSSGNVGIGISNPSIRLDVVGASAAAAVMIKPQGSLPNNNDNAGLYVLHQGTGGTAFRVRTDNAVSATTFAHILVNNASAACTALQVDQYGTGNIANFTKSGTSALMVTNAGDLCVGTTATLGGKVAIYGTGGGTNNYIQITNPGNGTACIGLGTTSSNVKVYNSYTSGTIGTGAGIDIDTVGRVMIGATVARASASKLELKSAANTALSIYMFKDAQVEVNMGFAGSNDTNFYINSGGTTIGASGVYLTNTGNSWNSVSDERMKTIVEPITNAAEKVSSLRTVIGYYNNDEKQIHRPFLIAQDVQAVLPEAVNVQNADTGTLGMSYTDVIPLMVAAIKELKALVDAQAVEIAALKVK